MTRKSSLVIGWIVLGLAGVLLALMFVMPSIMNPADTSPDKIEQIPLHGTMSVVAQVVEVNGNSLKIEVLEGNGYDVFNQRTGVYLQAEQPPEVEFVMGASADVQVGAIAQFDGIKLDADRMRLSRIVILTGYVEGPVQP